MLRIASRAAALSFLCAILPMSAPAQDASSDTFEVTITHADGSTRAGKVLKVERSEDWYAEKGWTDKPVKLTVTLEGNGTEVEKKWSEINSVEIAYGKDGDVDCQFDSSFSPIMYMCVLKTTTTVTVADGSTWAAASRHKWKFHFASGEPAEFYIHKLPEREQEATVATLGDGSSQNTELYQILQKRLMDKVKSSAVTKITIKKV